jgi:hypothetical protein
MVPDRWLRGPRPRPRASPGPGPGPSCTLFLGHPTRGVGYGLRLGVVVLLDG